MSNVYKTQLLLIEDEIAIRDMLKFSLSAENFCLHEAENCQQAETFLAQQSVDLILLDWMLPGKSGIEFTQQLKKNSATKNIPIIMLTAKAEEEYKIKGLETGADDYITKPFSPRELIARIKTILRRSGPFVDPAGILQTGAILLNIHSHHVSIQGQALTLSPINYRLLYFFMKHPDRVYSREQLLHYVWTDSLETDERAVDVGIKRLRQCLAPFNEEHRIKTIRSSGYQWLTTQ